LNNNSSKNILGVSKASGFSNMSSDKDNDIDKLEKYKTVIQNYKEDNKNLVEQVYIIIITLYK